MARHNTFLFAALLFAVLLSGISACRDETPSVPQQPSATDTNVATAPQMPADTVSILHDTLPGAVTGGSQPVLTPETRATLVRGVRQFITVIDSNDQQAFFAMLSQRSRRFIDQDRLATQDQVWDGARQTLGNINGRKISIIGGTRDSVSLLVDGDRLVDSERVADPVIIHMLREDGTWKVMYPGLLYPRHHLQK